MKRRDVEIETIIQHSTLEAIQVADSDDGPVTWLPRSRVTMEPADAGPGDQVTLWMTEETATDKGLI